MKTFQIKWVRDIQHYFQKLEVIELQLQPDIIAYRFFKYAMVKHQWGGNVHKCSKMASNVEHFYGENGKSIIYILHILLHGFWSKNYIIFEIIFE